MMSWECTWWLNETLEGKEAGDCQSGGGWERMWGVDRKEEVSVGVQAAAHLRTLYASSLEASEHQVTCHSSDTLAHSLCPSSLLTYLLALSNQ